MKKIIKNTTGFPCAFFSILLTSTVAHADIQQSTTRHLDYSQFSHHQVTIQTTAKGLSNAAATLTVTAYETGANGQQKASQTVTAYNKKGEPIKQLSPVISHATTDSFTGNTLSIADAKGNITTDLHV